MSETPKILDDNISTPVSEFLERQIEKLRMEGVSQRDIAREIGYSRPNILSMMKKGETKVPVDKVPAFARALKCDPVKLYRLVMQQYWPDDKELLDLVSDNSTTANEKEILKFIREMSGGQDPALGDALKNAIKGALSE